MTEADRIPGPEIQNMDFRPRFFCAFIEAEGASYIDKKRWSDMNYLWGGMLLLGILYGALTGRLDQVTESLLDSSREAVNLCISMAGITGLWCGIMRIGENSGLIYRITEKIRPLLGFLFPELPREHPAGRWISLNMIANFLGLGWAATPAGLKAMESLEKLEEDRRRGRLPGPAREKGTAGNEMCSFLILNISSLQLIPVSVIAYRSQYGSVNPAGIIGPGILATAASTAAAVVFCKIMDRKGRKHIE